MATENDKVNTGALGTLVLVGLFATLSIALAVTALVRYSVDGVTSARQTLVQQEYRELKQAQSDKLGAAPTWTDKGKGTVSIPIDRAKSRVLADLQRDPTSASPPPPAPAPTDAAVAPEGEIQMEDTTNTPAPASARPAPERAPKSEHAVLEKPQQAPTAVAAPTVAVAKPVAPAVVQPTPAAPKPAAAPVPSPKPTDG